MQVEYADAYEGQKHAHPCWEIVCYLEGGGTSGIDGKKYKFGKGNYAVIAPNGMHTEKGVSGTRVIYIGFDILDTECALTSGMYTDEKEEISGYIFKIYHEMQKQKAHSAAIMNLLVGVVLAKALDNEKETTKKKSELDYAVNYINTHYMNDISAKELADAVGYNYDYFRKIFKERMNVGVSDYIQNVKFHNAQYKILNTDESIKAIALSCGYSSPAHFCMAYKKLTGKTPYSVRKSGVGNKQLFSKK